MSDDTNPSSPAASVSVETTPRAGSSGATLVMLIVSMAVVAVLVCVSLVAVKAAAGALTAELKTLRQGNEEAYRWTKARTEETQRVLEEQLRAIRDIDISSPPTNDKLFTVVTKGLGVSENVVATGEVGTTPTAAFATDLTTAQQSDAYTQEMVITNRDDTTILCFKPIAWASAGANCAAKCAAQTITCPVASGAGTTATDGTVTPPGSSWPRRYDGTSCMCIVGSAASTAYQTERVLRRRSKRRVPRRRLRMTREVA